MPGQQAPLTLRSPSKKLMHGLSGFFSGLLAGPYVALKRAFNYFDYRLALTLPVAPWYIAAPILAVPMVISIIPYLLGYTVYAMGRGFFVGWHYAVYSIPSLHDVLSTPTHEITFAQKRQDKFFPAVSLTEEAKCGRAYLNRRFGMYEPGPDDKHIIDFLLSSNPIEQKLAQAYFKNLEKMGQKDLMNAESYTAAERFAVESRNQYCLDALEQYRTHVYAHYKGAYWEKIDGVNFCEYLVKTYAGDSQTLQHLRANGLTLAEIFANARAIIYMETTEYFDYNARGYQNSCAMILDTCTMPGVVIDPNSAEGKIVQGFLQSYLCCANNSLSGEKTYPIGNIEEFMLQNQMYKQIDYIVSYMFTGQSPYLISSNYMDCAIYENIEQSLHQLVHHHGDLFLQITLATVMATLIKNYLKFLMGRSARVSPTAGFDNAMVTMIGRCFANDKVDFLCDEQMSTFIEQVEQLEIPQAPSLVAAKEARAQRTVTAITASCPLPVELVAIVAGYKGTFFIPCPVADEASAGNAVALSLN